MPAWGTRFGWFRAGGMLGSRDEPLWADPERKENTGKCRKGTIAWPGPFEVPRRDGGPRVDKRQLKGFWKEVEAADKANEGLADASGCYIFGIRAGRGAKPWYVGQAKTAFRKECFASHKLVHYNEILLKRKGTPILFLLARKTPRGVFARTLREREANRLENLLIDYCLQANSDLLNIRGAAFLKEVIVPGLLNSPPGQPSKEAQFLRGLLSIRS